MADLNVDINTIYKFHLPFLFILLLPVLSFGDGVMVKQAFVD